MVHGPKIEPDNGLRQSEQAGSETPKVQAAFNELAGQGFNRADA